MASEGVGWWRKVFLGCDPTDDLAWLAAGYDHTNSPPVGWLVFNMVCCVVTIAMLVSWWRGLQESLKLVKQKSVSDEV